jgi:ethylbenzene hydroxylase subunit beta/complex iron-sulfur molybdoenzyme family reductase subunit beta
MDKEVAPACVRQCPGRCIWVGYLDDADGPVYKLVQDWKVALPLHAEFGTKPNVYYVPPLSPPRLDGDGNIDSSQPRIPMDYLRSLFGPEVDNALASLKNEIEKKKNKEESGLMDILIVKRWQELLGSFEKDPSEVQA